MSGKGLVRRLMSDLPVKVICLTAAVILFLFHRVNTMTERFFSVPLEVSVPPGLAIASAYPKTVRITLRGTEESISPILEEDIEATADLQAHKSPGVFRSPVRISLTTSIFDDASSATPTMTSGIWPLRAKSQMVLSCRPPTACRARTAFSAFS